MAKDVPTLTNETIINSTVFRFINIEIDKRARLLQYLMDDMAALLAGCETSYGCEVTVRTHEESLAGQPTEVQLKYNIRGLVRIYESIEQCRQLEREIGDLQRSKLHLLNDYDFTHGVNEQQIAVFGTTPSGGN